MDNRQLAEQIVDTVVAFGRKVHLIDQHRIAQDKLLRVGTVCGDCYWWMKSSHCPREHNVKGHNCGPHMNEIKCSKFQMDDMAAKRRVELTAEVERLAAAITTA